MNVEVRDYRNQFLLDLEYIPGNHGDSGLAHTDLFPEREVWRSAECIFGWKE
jgi:hypothetical protein